MSTQDRDSAEVNKSDLGQYLASVEERDIDLLLMEEFHVSDDFVRWFCEQVGLANAHAAGAWHSVSDTDGETDLLLRVVHNGRRVGILIENKVKAPEQDRQGERYHLRGRRSRDAGKFEDYVTVICAPQRYLDALSQDCAYQHKLAYEAIADWFRKAGGRRATWRQSIMLEAVEQSCRGYTMLVNATNTAFFFQYWEYLQAKHPHIMMRRPSNKGSKSNWIIMKGFGFPQGVNIHHKFDQRVVELGFDRRHIDEILAARPEWPEDILVVQKGRTASLMIKVPPIDMKIGITQQIKSIEEALKAAYRLMPYANLLSNNSPNA